MGEVSAKSLTVEALPAYRGPGQIGLLWDLIRAPLIVPLLRVSVYICLAMSIMVFLERLYMGVVIVLVKLFWKKPEKRYKFEPMCDDDDDDIEIGSEAFPTVLVQIPMFNEKEVYKISIGAACNLSWPSDKLVIQVLDDSTDLLIKDMVEKECIRWGNKGINIRYQIRETRGGYKAGALKEGLKHDYVKNCEYVVIFDADFRPEPDFLRRAVPFLIHNPDIALVQGRWRFGTGGIWRIAAINEAGGWKDRTTVEDMDLAVRAGLKGWKFLYLGDLQVKSELPSTFKAFRFQQHRWSCGPANLFRKMVMEIATNKKVTLYKKFYVIYSFFFVRKIIAHMFTFFFYCVVLPLTILVPEVDVPKWGAIYIPCIITTLNSVGTPRSFHLLFYWVLFENVMSFHRTKATLIGLLEAKRVNEWVVTEKLGDTLKNKSKNKSIAPKRSLSKFLGDRILVHELGFAMFLFICGCYDFLYGKNNYFIYLFLQVITFTIAGFGYVGTIVPSS
ncbi:Glucomannan 4-beta-mannosyltransferase 2 [Striga hermonthica]|uniref:Glucomannan 4-beta-mannosyltransferase 2 n=1 Tax=Striga hermonthica TaxID=68872 RepID=A0A9N7R5W6_STRHE|nr:Glucomannan 4-beta-mannosyltransferase 2 [Striga hermonthica]